MLGAISPTTGSETIAVADALHRVLAEDVRAPISLPPFPASAMDGYALRATDAGDARPYTFTCIGTSSAGHPFTGEVPVRACVRIFTGAPVPEGLDAVAIQEDCRVVGTEVCVDELIRPGDNIRHIGQDVEAGTIIAERGDVIGPFESAWFTACGLTHVSVRVRPRITILSTGDELIEPGRSLAPGQIYDSNRAALKALLQDLPVELIDIGIVPDSQHATVAALDTAAADSKLIITTGGVSVGDADHVKQAVEARGELLLWRLNLKPGKPLAFGRVGNACFLGLPGNPVSTIVTALLLARPLLLHLAGAKPTPALRVRATLEGTLKHRPGREEYQRGILVNDLDCVRVTVTGDQGSNRLASFRSANCLIRIPATAA
ncbi:MAG: gephyrin-like molybdotransferase Glp, partial [Pseudomonadales bacterium]